VSRRRKIIIAVYIDDILVLSPDKAASTEVYNALRKHFKIENLGAPKTFLGLNIVRDWSMRSISINQTGYIDRMLVRFNMANAVPAKTPLDPSLPLLKAKPGDKRCNVKEYQEIMGSLNHLAVFSRPDIAYAISYLAQFNADPIYTHLNAIRHVLRYLKGTRTLSIAYGNAKSLAIFGFADADWAGDRNDRISYTGYLFFINNAPVSWSTYKQTTVALSSMESEYMSLSDASREVIARLIFFDQLEINTPPPLLRSDNQAALKIAENPTDYQRAKHIDIRYHFIRHALQRDQIVIDYIPTAEQPADALTKALGPQKHQHLVKLMGLH
jgi:hypothetical protein